MDPLSRRTFIKQTGALTALSMAGLSLPAMTPSAPLSPIRIVRVNSDFEREPMAKPWGFKGGMLTEIWQSIARIESDKGFHAIGLGTQSVLWCDSSVFAEHTESGGNALMYAMTEHALQLLKDIPFTDPISLLDELLEPVLEYGRKITGHADLRKTFALTALVPVDNAAWLLYAKENDMRQFDEMIPQTYRPGLSFRNEKVAALPALGYGTSMEEIKRLADAGFFLMKIKIGAPGDQQEMLRKDIEFMTAIHKTIGGYETPHTANGKIPYYFDANGRYDSKDTLHRFLDAAEKIGALEQITVVEEPFGERNQQPVHDIAERGPRVAADESAHTDADSIDRIEQGYNAIAVKAIAKTLSMTLKIVKEAHDRDVPCFCADLTVNPILVEWNKCVAARLAPFPGLPFGLQETNGWQNYRNWKEMMTYNPTADASWTQPKDGVYLTGEEFIAQSGGIFEQAPHYENMF
jgi:L-alanine-DL-glutamate epimerase-like enolase superfamily enzyme